MVSGKGEMLHFNTILFLSVYDGNIKQYLYLFSTAFFSVFQQITHPNSPLPLQGCGVIPICIFSWSLSTVTGSAFCHKCLMYLDKFLNKS